MAHLRYRFYEQPCPIMFEFIPQTVAGSGKVPGTRLYKEAILYFSFEQESVKDFILPVF